jgi:hypothetical protein
LIFTKAAEEKNAENLLIVKDRRLVELYTRDWKEHEVFSEDYRGRRR